MLHQVKAILLHLRGIGMQPFIYIRHRPMKFILTLLWIMSRKLSPKLFDITAKANNRFRPYSSKFTATKCSGRLLTYKVINCPLIHRVFRSWNLPPGYQTSEHFSRPLKSRFENMRLWISQKIN